MSECYWGEVTLTIPETIPNPFTKDFDVDKFDTEAFLAPIFGREPLSTEVSVEYDRLIELIDEVTSWAIDCELYEADHDTVTFGGEHNYGIAFWTENSTLEETCRANGIAYHLQDEGKYEIPGEARSWKPGQAQMLHRAVICGGEIALAQGLAATLWTNADGDLAAFGAAVRAYFEDLD